MHYLAQAICGTIIKQLGTLLNLYVYPNNTRIARCTHMSLGFQ